MISPPPVTTEEAARVCLLGGGVDRCRYLVASPTDDGVKFGCTKNLPGIKEMLQGMILAGTAKAHGDNCEGKQPT